MYFIQNAMHVKLVRFLSSMYQHEFSLESGQGNKCWEGAGGVSVERGREMCWEGAGECVGRGQGNKWVRSSGRETC